MLNTQNAVLKMTAGQSRSVSARRTAADRPFGTLERRKKLAYQYAARQKELCPHELVSREDGHDQFL